MNRILMFIVSLPLVSILTGCGIEFNDRNINLELSPEMLGACVFEDTEIMKRHLDEIPGYIVIDDGTGNLSSRLPLQVGGFKPNVTAISEDRPFYHSVIDESAGVQGSYLSILSI